MVGNAVSRLGRAFSDAPRFGREFFLPPPTSKVSLCLVPLRFVLLRVSSITRSLCVAFDTAIQQACCTLFDLPSPLPAEARIDLHALQVRWLWISSNVSTSRAGFWAAAAAALPTIVSTLHQGTVLQDLPLVRHLWCVLCPASSLTLKSCYQCSSQSGDVLDLRVY